MKNKLKGFFKEYINIKNSFLEAIKSRKYKIKSIWNRFNSSDRNKSLDKKINKKNSFF